MKQFQIGIIGSAADLNYSNETEQFAKELGRLIAKSNNILVYGAEKEYTSLSMVDLVFTSTPIVLFFPSKAV